MLLGLYNRLDEGHDIDAETVNAIIAMSGQPTLDGIIENEVIEAAQGDDPHPQEDHRPALQDARRSIWRRWPATT